MFTIKFGITFFYGGATFLIYTMIVIMMFKNWKSYNTTYFKFFIADYFYNFLTFLNSCITLRIPQNTCKNCIMSFLFKSNVTEEDYHYPLPIFATIHYSMAFVQYSMIFIMSANRFTMILRFATYDKHWKPIFPYVLIVVSILPLIVTYPVPLNRTYYLYDAILDCYVIHSEANVSSILGQLIKFMIVSTFLTAALNILSFCRLAFSSHKVPGAERNLFFVSFCLFAIQLFAVTNMLVYTYLIDATNQQEIWARLTVLLIPFVSDCLTLSHPWLLLLFSSKVRSSVLKMYCRRFSDSKNQSVVNVSFAITNRTLTAS